MHRELIGELQSRIIPVDAAMSSDIFSASFYRQEFVVQEKEMDEIVKNSDEEQKEAIKSDEELKENKSDVEELVDDESQDQIIRPPFGPRTEVF